ncbi:MAG: hypothetical protein AWU57_298 [Marinobacter sp. T13-3]|nr:MAG: hypothetical protein AWU57_298 [Marinobacter sp. T13-3]
MPTYLIPGDTGLIRIRGDLGPHCANADCFDVGEYACDYPVGKGKTCDRVMCENHAYEVAPDVHYCPGHFQQWEAFRKAGGVKQELANVTPYRRNPPLTEENNDGNDSD